MGAEGIFFDTGPPGTWRAALEPNASCAAFQQAICGHDDLTYAGIAPEAAAAPGSFSGHATPMPGFPVDSNSADATAPIRDGSRA